MIKLDEMLRKELIKGSKLQSPQRLAKSKSYSVKDFKEVNFKQLFTDDRFVWDANVGDYIVTIAFEGPFEELKWYVKSMRGPNRIKRISHKVVMEALSRALDDNDLFVNCTCGDFTYRFSYWASKFGYKYGKKEKRKPKFKQTNMHNDNGRVCKHLLAVLIGKRWVYAAAKAWLQYIQANVELSEFYLFGKDWTAPPKPKKTKPIEDNKPNEEKPTDAKQDDSTNEVELPIGSEEQSEE